MEGVCPHGRGYDRSHIHLAYEGKKLMFLDKVALLEVASIIANGFVLAAVVVGASIILAKVVEVFGIRRFFSRKRK